MDNSNIKNFDNFAQKKIKQVAKELDNKQDSNEK